METDGRTTPRKRCEFLVATLNILVVLSLIFPTNGFLFPARPQLILNIVSLRSEENQIGRDPQEEKVQTSLQGYQGGMIRPVVIAANSGGSSSDLMRVDGQDTFLQNNRNLESPQSPRHDTQTNMFRPSGMFRPSTVRANNDRIDSNPVSEFLDELKDVGYSPDGKNGERAESGAAVIRKRSLYEREQVEAALELDRLESETKSELETEVYAKHISEESIARKIEPIVESAQENISGAELKKFEHIERQENRPTTINKEEVDTIGEKKRIEMDTKENAKAESKEEMSPPRSLEEKELKATDDVMASENIKPSPIDFYEIEEEAEKLKDIEAMIQQRKAQQIELDKMDEDLLRKTIEIQKKTEELLRLEDEFADAERKVRMNSSGTEKILPRETGRTIPHYSPKEYSALSLEEKVKLKAERDALSKIQDEVDAMYDDDGASRNNTIHPILGPVIADLGCKRVHVVSSGRLGTIPIWKKQRTYRFDRVKIMASEKANSMHLGFPGIICLHEDAKGKLSIIDGQHRVGMMQALRGNRNRLKKNLIKKDGQGENDKAWKEQEKYFQNVLVEVYSDLSIEDATHTTNKDHDYSKQIFSEINKAQPMALINAQDVMSERERKIISKALSSLRHMYGEMFSSSRQCRNPDVNIDNLLHLILGSNLLKRHKTELTTGKKLVNWLIVQNAAIGELYENDPVRQFSVEPTAWKKASKNGFYLGMESSWLYK